MKKRNKKIILFIILGVLIFNKYTVGIILMSWSNFTESHRVVDIYSEESPNSLYHLEIKQTELHLMPDPNIKIICTNNATNEYTVEIKKKIDLSRVWVRDDIQFSVEWQNDENGGFFQVFSTQGSQRKFDPVPFSCK